MIKMMIDKILKTRKNIKMYLGVDWGEVRIGLSIADSEVKIATPLKTVKNINELIKIIRDENIDKIIIGKPFNISDLSFETSDLFKNFVKILKCNINIPIEFIDERLSSKAADALEGDKKNKASRDEISAMLILQQYLDRKYGSNL